MIFRDSWAWDWLIDASVRSAEKLFERQRWQASTWIVCKIGKLCALISTKDNLSPISFQNQTWPFDLNMVKFLWGLSCFNWVSIYFSQISRTLLIWLLFNFITIFVRFVKLFEYFLLNIRAVCVHFLSMLLIMCPVMVVLFLRCSGF